jgi:hypothetical protein
MRITPFILAALLAASALVPAMPARGADLRGGVARLFELGLKNTSPDVAAARAQYERLKSAVPKDPRLDYAYGVVLLNQHRYADALPLVDKYVAANARDRDASLVRLWALMQARRYDDALSQAAAIVDGLPKPPPADAGKYLDSVRSIGKVVAYLEAMQPATLDPQAKTARTNQILARLGKAYLPAFDEGRHEVADRFSKFQQQRQATVERRELAAQQRLQEITGAVKENEATVDAGRQIVDASSEQLRDARRSVAVVQLELASLNQDRLRVGAQIITVQARLSEYQPIQTTIFDPSLRDPNFRGQQTSTTTSNVRAADFIQMQSLAMTLAVLNRQAFEMDRRILGLRAEAAKALGKGQQETQTLAESQTAISKAERRAANLEKQVRRLETQKPAPTGALSSEMKRLSTYLPFPYDDESKRVLAWFAN